MFWLVTTARLLALTNGLALTPPMGYNSWYANGSTISETFIRNIADQMSTNGMLAAGYNFINLDDGWAGYRDPSGFMIPDTNKFPHGMKALADYVHAKGFKLGLYTVSGTNTCALLPGSSDHIEQDAATYASWGIDYLKYEGCSIPSYEIIFRQQIYIMRMMQALQESGRPILFSASIASSFEDWMPRAINLWRGTGDANGQWITILNHIDFISQTPRAAGPGQWNDPDVLEIGNNFFNANECRTIFSMWCELSAPLLTLISGNGFTNYFCNADAIAIDQDAAGVQGVCLNSTNLLQVWNKPIGSTNSSAKAVVLFNRSTTNAPITVQWRDLGLPDGVATVYDNWAHTYRNAFTNSYTGLIPPRGVQFLRINADSILAQPAFGTNYLGDLPWLADSTGAIIFSNNAPFLRNSSSALSPITLHGIQYAKGFGTLAPSQTSFFLGNATGRFKSDVGLDDAALTLGSLIFSVYLDGVKFFDSGTMTTASPTQTIDLDISGHNVLTLVVTNGVPGNVNDYADWAGARLEITPSLPSIPTSLTANSVSTNINLHWNLSFGATNYLIKRATSPNGSYTNIGSSTNAKFTDSTAQPGVEYFYVVSAVNSFGPSSNSALLNASLVANWLPTNSAAIQTWSQNSNWTNTPVYPNASSVSVAINSAIASNQTITLSNSVTIGSLSIGSPDGTAPFLLTSSGGSLIFDDPYAETKLTQTATSHGDEISAPMTLNTNLIIANQSPNQLTLSGNLNGTGGLEYLGPGVLALSGSNDFQGSLVITNGLVKNLNPYALGRTNSLISIQPGASLDLSGFSTGSRTVIATGAGADSSGAIINSSTNALTSALQHLQLSGDASIGGNTRWDLRNGTLSSQGFPRSLTKLGTNQISLADVSVDAALGDINLISGILSLENSTTSLGNPANPLTIQPGATMSFQNTTTAWNKQFHLGSDGVTPSMLSTSGNNTITGTIFLETTNLVSVASGSLTLAGPILGTNGIIKDLAGKLILNGFSSLAGPLQINQGTVAFGNQSSLSAIPQLQLSSTSILDVSTLPSGATFGDGQSLFGNGLVLGNLTLGTGASISCTNHFGTLTFSNSLTLTTEATCNLELSPSINSNDVIKVLGTLTLGGTLNLINSDGTAYNTNNSFKIFTASNLTGTFFAIQPRTPGNGQIWDTSTLSTDGVLRIKLGNLPRFTTSHNSNGSLQMTGVNGKPNTIFYVLTATNAALPSVKWDRIATNYFDSTGGFSISNLISTNSPSLFYQLLIP